MSKTYLSILFLGLLIGCVPPMTREEQLAIYRSRCLDYGYLKGTPEFAACMMKQEARHEKLTVQMRKADALEEHNWIEKEKMRTKKEKLNLEHSKRKIKKQ